MNKNTKIQEGKKNKLINSIFLYPIALLLLFEEWGWEPLAQLFARLGRLPFWAWIEHKILRMPPWGVLFVFAVPVISLIPVKLFGFYLFAKGYVVLGASVIVSAKILGTAICARIFQLSRSSLMRIKWFAFWYPRWKNWKDRLMNFFKRSELWRKMQSLKYRIKIWWVKIHP